MMTSDALPCAHCQTGDKPVWRGYVPWYDQDYQRKFVVISEDFFVSVGDIPLHGQIHVLRETGSRSPVIVRPAVWRMNPWKPPPDKAENANIMPALLLIWKDFELHQWHRKATIDPMQVIGSRLEFEGKPLAEHLAEKGHHNLINRMKSGKEPATLDSALDALMPQPVKQPTNGKHVKKK